MRRALRRHRRDIVAPLIMVVLGLAVLVYVLAHQPAFTPPGFVPGGKDLYTFKARFTSAPAIVSGQGQTVNIAGVPVGDVKSIALVDGQAIIELEIEKRYAPVYRDATILLRPRTPLKDMYLALDPGSRSSGALPEGGTLPASQTLPDVNFDEVLANLDADTRAYLRIILSAGGAALRDPPDAPADDGAPSARAVDDLRTDYKLFEPLARDGRALFAELAKRQRNVKRVVSSMRQVAGEIGAVDSQLASLIDASDSSVAAIAAQDENLRAALSEFPGALRQTSTALRGVRRLEAAAGPALRELEPFAEAVGPSLRATRPFLETSTPIIRDELRPFARDARPVVESLAPATSSVESTIEPLERTLGVFNAFFDALAYDPPGAEEGYLFWATWLAHIGPSLFTAQDAMGATPRGLLLATCAQLGALHQVEIGNPSLGPILRLLNTADRLKFCDADVIRR